MRDLLNTLKENKFFETKEKNVFIKNLYGSNYIVEVLIYNEAIGYLKIINRNEYFEFEFNGDKSVYNLEEILRNAYNIASIVQNRIKEKRLSLNRIQSLLKQKYPEWAMFKFKKKHYYIIIVHDNRWLPVF